MEKTEITESVTGLRSVC